MPSVGTARGVFSSSLCSRRTSLASCKKYRGEVVEHRSCKHNIRLLDVENEGCFLYVSRFYKDIYKSHCEVFTVDSCVFVFSNVVTYCWIINARRYCSTFNIARTNKRMNRRSQARTHAHKHTRTQSCINYKMPTCTCACTTT